MALRRLILSGALLIAMASAATAQSSGAIPGGGVAPNALTAPNARSTGACTADTSCASFPLTPLGAANPSLAPRLNPVVGAPANQTGSALTAPPLVASPNPAGAINPAGSALASPGIGAQPAGLNQTGGINRTGTAPLNPAAGTPATRAPSMSSNAFQSQCANAPGCSAFQGQ